ncbi:MAG: hypothetical protein JST85_20780 [Acidobacteria bacterium]|nr:hypothetical protein [Acidobacteriota bacterium]
MLKNYANLIAVICFTLFLTSNTFAQENGRPANNATMKTSNRTGQAKHSRYANQEVSYRKAKSSGTIKKPNTVNQFDRGYLPPAAKSQNQRRGTILPYIEQGNLRKSAGRKRK